MASITVRNLDDQVKRRLRMRAAGNGHSLEAEVRDILTRSAQTSSAPHPTSGLDLFKPIRDAVEKYGGVDLDIPPRTALREIGLDGARPQKASRRLKSADATKKSDTSVGTLRNAYGDVFAEGARGDTKNESLVRDVATDFRRTSDTERSTRRRK